MKYNQPATTGTGLTSIVVLHFFLIFLQPSEFKLRNFPVDISAQNESGPAGKTDGDIFDLDKDDISWVDSVMNSMPLYEKCAQVFMPAVFDQNLNLGSPEFQRTLELVRDHGIGGIVISLGKVEETAAMINELQKNAEIPLLVSADFENGIGMRIEGMNTFPHNMALGATDNPEYAYQLGKATAFESNLLGVNINFAPVADINNNPENPVINLRAFSEDRDIVTDYCLAHLEGSRDGRVIATAKHFPGHGNTRIDSHKDLPVISGSKEYLLKNEIIPFIKLIDNGVPAVMSGHLSVPAFEQEKNLPSSLSYNIITKLLKEELGFKGLVITDALDMKAVTNYYSDEEAVIKAFTAGNDILLMPPDVLSGIKALYEAVKSGSVTEERLNYSVRKILEAKRWLKIHLHRTRNLNRIAERILVREHNEIAQRIADESVTIVKMKENIIPLNPKQYSRPCVINITNRGNDRDQSFFKLLNNDFLNATGISLTAFSRDNDYRDALNRISDSDLIIITAYFTVRTNGNTKMLDESQIGFIKKILKLNKKVLLISFENPYILSLFPETENYICSYSNTEVSQRAVLKVLSGLTESRGRLPVSIPGTEFKIGHRWEMEE